MRAVYYCKHAGHCRQPSVYEQIDGGDKRSIYMPEMKMKKREKIIIVPHAPLLNGKTGHEVLDLTLSPTLSPSHTFLSHVSLSNHIKFSGSQRKVDSASESDSERSSSAAAPVDSPRRTRCFVFRRTSDFLLLLLFRQNAAANPACPTSFLRCRCGASTVCRSPRRYAPSTVPPRRRALALQTQFPIVLRF